MKRKSSSTNPATSKKEFIIGDYLFNYPLRMLTYKPNGVKEKKKLSPKEAHLLRLLCLHMNDVLLRSEALIEIWGEDDYFTGRSMDVFVTKLRKYLKKDANLRIVSVHGSGFRLVDKYVPDHYY